VQGRESDAILTVKLNDMGHYGCSSDCTDKIAVPLHAEATVQLIRRRSMSSLLAHSKYQHFLSATRCIFFSLNGTTKMCVRRRINSQGTHHLFTPLMQPLDQLS
jgi:hypothetical protein